MSDRSIDSVRLLYDTAKDVYEHVHDVTQRLDNKANVVIGFIGIIVGFGLKWVFDIYARGYVPQDRVGFVASLILAFSLCHFILAIHKAIKAFKPAKFNAVDATKAICINADLKEIKVMENIAWDYAETAAENNDLNTKKAELIERAFNHFKWGLVLFSIFIGLLLLING